MNAVSLDVPASSFQKAALCIGNLCGTNKKCILNFSIFFYYYLIFIYFTVVFESYRKRIQEMFNNRSESFVRSNLRSTCELKTLGTSLDIRLDIHVSYTMSLKYRWL